MAVEPSASSRPTKVRSPLSPHYFRGLPAELWQDALARRSLRRG